MQHWRAMHLAGLSTRHSAAAIAQARCRAALVQDLESLCQRAYYLSVFYHLPDTMSWVADESAREAEARDLADVTWAGAPKTALPQCRGDKQVPRPAGKPRLPGACLWDLPICVCSGACVCSWL